MYEILFFKDRNGREPVKEYILELSLKKKIKIAGSILTRSVTI